MAGWDIYQQRMQTKRDMWLRRDQQSILRRSPDTLSWHAVTVDGNQQELSIISQTEHDTKRICAMPGETLPHGALVEYADAVWLITEVDSETEVYHRGIMLRCNHKLRWINREGAIVEKWCVVEDGTKYLVGEQARETMTIGDARIAVTVGKDRDTVELRRGQRFLIDDEDVLDPAAYQISKANRFFNTSSGRGCFRYILTETPLTQFDNVALRIADYSNWTPDRVTDGDHRDSDLTIEEVVQEAKDKDAAPPGGGTKGWL